MLPGLQMRALLFVSILTSGIVDAMEAVEKATEAALDFGDLPPPAVPLKLFHYCPHLMS
jgi:hypothetical protein